MTSQELSTILRLQTYTSGELELSPCDLFFRGRSIPMLWYYRDVLDTDRLKTSLLQTLEHFPVLCGRSVCINLFKSSLYLYFGLHVQSTSTSCLVYVWLGPYFCFLNYIGLFSFVIDTNLAPIFLFRVCGGRCALLIDSKITGLIEQHGLDT